MFYNKIEVKFMHINLDWNKDFQECQDILNSGIHHEQSYNTKVNLILNPEYTGQGKQFSLLKILLKPIKQFIFIKVNIESRYLKLVNNFKKKNCGVDINTRFYGMIKKLIMILGI